jgi:glycosidase
MVHRIRAFAPFAFAPVLLAGCGNDTTNVQSFGSPPDAAAFDTGPGGNNGGYGSGGNNGTGDGGYEAGPPVCPDTLKRCAETFTYPFNNETSVELRGDYRTNSWTTGDPMVHSGNQWSVTVPVPYGKAVQYKFLVNGTSWLLDPSNPQTVPDGTGNTNSLKNAITCTNYTCDQPGPPPPGVYDWRDSVIYFVFVDRFLDGDPTNDCNVAGTDAAGNYMGGDWAGVTQKINAGYFTDLGVNTLWLTVPFKNADTFAGHGVGGDTHMYSAYHGYWPYDPAATESCFGAKADLVTLVQAAHAKNLKVLFDYAMVHVQIASPVYTQNPSWFWPNSKNGSPDCICGGQYCDWNADAQICWFTDYLPHWNYTVQAARDYSVNAAVQLVKDTGADGFRLDAIKHVDGSWLLELRSNIQNQIIAPENPPQRFYMVGETYDFSNRDFIKSFIDPATKLDGQFDFPERLNLIQSVVMRQTGMDSLASFMDSNDGYYGVDAVMSPFVGNHDLPRSIHFGEDNLSGNWTNPYWDGKALAWQNQPQLPAYRNPFERLANAFAVLLTNRGAPLVYYGDEIGLPGAGDPDNRRMMQWSNLSADQQWLHDRVKALATIRAAHPALRRGVRTTISVTSDVWLYSMQAGTDLVYVAVNRGDASQQVTGLPSQALNELLSGTTVTGPGATIAPRQTGIWVTH